MQSDYSTATDFMKELEDDGRSLLAIDQWCQEIESFRKLDVKEEYELVERARSGCPKAKLALLESCFPYIYGVAKHYASLPSCNSDIMDLVQVGNEVAIANFEECLKSRYPTGFLCFAAKHAIITYYREDKPIRVPTTSYSHGHRAPLTVSLMTPLYDDVLLLEVLPDNIPSSSDVSPYTEILHGALSRLSFVQRECIVRRNGFEGYGEHSLNETGRILGKSGACVNFHAGRARKFLRQDVELCKAVGVEVEA
jgi:DNA-directed RNA polymerase specialized sigma24 family protein